MTMESISCWPESLPSKRKKAIEELNQGIQLTNKLLQMLRQQQQPEKPTSVSVDGVVIKILEVFDKAISILTFNQNHKETESPATGSDGQELQQLDQSVQIRTKRGCYKRRKTLWTSTKVTLNMIDDGYAWRKYGQKMILNTKHQRNYYRCTHKFDQGCQATKQVQKTEDEPPKYKITYNGHHTCKNLERAPQTILDSSNPREKMVLLTFKRQGLIENKQVNLSLGSRCNQASSFNQRPSRNPTNNDTQAPLKHMLKMSSGLDHNDMIFSGVSSVSSNRGYHTVQMLGKDDFGELCL